MSSIDKDVRYELWGVIMALKRMLVAGLLVLSLGLSSLCSLSLREYLLRSPGFSLFDDRIDDVVADALIVALFNVYKDVVVSVARLYRQGECYKRALKTIVQQGGTIADDVEQVKIDLLQRQAQNGVDIQQMSLQLSAARETLRSAIGEKLGLAADDIDFVY